MLLPTSKTLQVPELALHHGGLLAPLTTAYETFGTLNTARDNAILLCHGYTNHAHAAGDESGWWHVLIGPGKAIDTERFFVVCANMIGSAFGSTGPASINPATGRPFGATFPRLATSDMVETQRRLLEHLGVTTLRAVIGYSYGGTLAFTWAETYPDMMRAVVVVASSIKGRGDDSMITAMENRFAKCGGWNGGDFYDADPSGTVREELKAIRIETLRGYGVAGSLRDSLGSDQAAAQQLDKMGADWAAHFDPHSLIVLRRAAMEFDGRPNARAIKAPLLYVLSRTDAVYPPALAEPTMTLLKDVGVSAEYCEIDSAYGHAAPAADWAKWSDTLAKFLQRHA